MRVITGTARGRKLKTLEGLDVRPTSDMVKEAAAIHVAERLESHFLHFAIFCPRRIPKQKEQIVAHRKFGRGPESSIVGVETIL